MSAEPRLVVDPLEVHARLRELGLIEEDLSEPLLAGASALALSLGTNHPPMFPGLNFWAEAVRCLRDRKMAEYWSKSDAKNYATVISPDRTMQIAVARGDEWTGRENAPEGRPSTQHKKGSVTQLAVEKNHQLSLFDTLPTPDVTMPDAAIVTWVLLHFRDRGRIRAELSRPTIINQSGFVEEWAERLILNPINLDPTRIVLPDDQPVEPDVLVRRRA